MCAFFDLFAVYLSLFLSSPILEALQTVSLRCTPPSLVFGYINVDVQLSTSNNAWWVPPLDLYFPWVVRMAPLIRLEQKFPSLEAVASTWQTISSYFHITSLLWRT